MHPLVDEMTKRFGELLSELGRDGSTPMRGDRERLARRAIEDVVVRRKSPPPGVVQTEALVSMLLARGTAPPPKE